MPEFAGQVCSLSVSDFKEACCSLALPAAWQPGGTLLRDALVTQLESGDLDAHGWRPTPEATAWETVLLSKTLAAGHRVILAALGAWHERSARELVTDLQRRQLVLTAVPDQFPHPVEDLLALGFGQAERQTWCNHLLNTDFSGWENPDFRVLPWNPMWLEPAKELVLEAHKATLSGLILTWPDIPTASHLRAVVDRLCAPGGNLLPDASFIALEHDSDALLGVIWLELTPSGPLLHELCVTPPARRRGVARALVGAAQYALKQAGHTDMLYTTLESNTGVARLGVPHDTRVVETEAFAAWLSPQIALPDSATAG